MELKLLEENDPVLEQPCAAWDFTQDGDPAELVKAMARLMIESNGIGLAASQCGVLKRIFVMGNETNLVVVHMNLLGENGTHTT